jgi:hypothetical protein
MKKVHIWIGTTSKNENEFDQYFDQNNDLCQFCMDLGIEQYDEDFIGIIPLLDHETDIHDILAEVPIDEKCIDLAIDNCAKLGIQKANAVFYLTDSSVPVEGHDDKLYNGLRYIGVFDSDL